MSLVSSSADFEQLFESAPISLWLEDYSALKTLFETLRSQGVVDLKTHIRQAPELLSQCSACYKVLKVNQKTLQVFAAKTQDELVSRLSEVFRDDMFENMVAELDHLWQGKLDFSNQTVNYALDGRRIDAHIQVRVLAGHEDTWDQVMVSLQDITQQVKAQQALSLSEQHARNLFDYSPVSLWVEDFSNVKLLLDEARDRGIEDFRVFISVHPEFVQNCMNKIEVIDVNRQTLSMFAAHDKDELLGKLNLIFRDEMRHSFAEQLVDLWRGKTVQMREVINDSLSGELINKWPQTSQRLGWPCCRRRYAAPCRRGAGQCRGRPCLLRGAYWRRRICGADAGL